MSTADIDDRTATMTAYKELLCRLARRTRDIFNSELIGIYLHGSCAMGCFNPYKSDLDIIVVIDGDISDERKLRFMENLICFDDVAPAKGIEISVVQRRFCKPFVYPTPYELHYSRMHRSRYLSDPHGYVRLMKGVDKDLAAHITIINNCGIVLYGDKISDVFGAVPTENFIDSVYGDIEHAREEISHKPIYVALNLC
ncbi:MAG: DUF4111 domain-containing protein, partial [Clostridiales bacterium]|nr:DUF4111 domain-containing protein [Clostridiales bacterium]